VRHLYGLTPRLNKPSGSGAGDSGQLRPGLIVERSGNDLATAFVANMFFKALRKRKLGRQTQSWVRVEGEWRSSRPHVSRATHEFTFWQEGITAPYLAEGFGQAPQGGAPPASGSRANGVRLAVKDVFQNQGPAACGAGTRSGWLETKSACHANGPVVAMVAWMLAPTWVGKPGPMRLTTSCWAGSNAPFTYAAAPGRSSSVFARRPLSSGSVVPVAAGYADLALGTDFAVDRSGCPPVIAASGGIRPAMGA